jgi:hypothetical protein
MAIGGVSAGAAGGRLATDLDAVPALLAWLGDLADARVRHCAWKSNDHLLAALAGETDLDLLIDPDDAARFAAVVSRHGLKEALPSPSAAYPAVQHYLGLDHETGQLFHLHVHFQLVLGERYVKNHRLPVERELLDGSRALHGVPVPLAELDLGVLVVRALLKYRARDVVKDVLRIRAPGIPAETLAEIAWLRDSRDLEVIRSRLAVLGAVVPVDLVCSFLQVVESDPRSGRELMLLRGRLRRALRERQRRSRLRARTAYSLALWRCRLRRLLGQGGERGMTLHRGGTTFALIGADGSGKSTIAGEVACWLGWRLEARVHYMGSKAPSPLTNWLYLGFRALRRSHRATSRRWGEGSVVARPIAALRDLALASHHLSVALDRRRHYARAAHDARAGRIVIFDRHPLACLSGRLEHQLLDGPQIAAVLGPPPGSLMGAIARFEARLYRRFGLPDHLVLLDVDPAAAARRKPDHHLDLIRSKARAAAELAALARATGAHVMCIDANQTLDRVLLDVKRRVWDVL